MKEQDKDISKLEYQTGSSYKQIGVNPTDECYTDFDDILTELNYWARLDKFRGKNIICPCDWDIIEGEDIYSIEIIYSDNGIAVTGNNVERITVSLWESPSKIVKIVIGEDEMESFLRDKLTCNFVNVLTQRARRWGIKSITASGYNPANNMGYPFQSIDYSKYDICITNPPFSLYATFLETILGKIDFILLAPMLNRAVYCEGLPLMQGKLFLGKGRRLRLNFNNPTKENKYSTKQVQCDWITSFPDRQREVDKTLYSTGISYEQHKHRFFQLENMTMRDGTHPIRLNNIRAMPDDYDGWMMASVTILDYLSNDYFEWYCTKFTSYYNELPQERRPFMETDQSILKHDGKTLFTGIVFRKKPQPTSNLVDN